MQVHGAGNLFVFHDGFKRTGSCDLRDGCCRVRAIFGEPVLVEVHNIMHLPARLTSQTAQGEVLDGRSKSIGRMALDMGEIDQEGRILDKAGHFPDLNVLIRSFVFVVVFLIRPGGGIDRAAEGF